jgi:hypothetical protein
MYRQALMHDDPKIKIRAIGSGMKGGCADDDELAAVQKEQGWGLLESSVCHLPAIS